MDEHGTPFCLNGLKNRKTGMQSSSSASSPTSNIKQPNSNISAAATYATATSRIKTEAKATTAANYSR